MKEVPFYSYERMYETEKSYVSVVMEEVLSRSDFILREDLFKFEREIAVYVGASFSAGVANGTDAIWLALIAAGVRAGDEVILPSHTYIATADAVRFLNATPVLVDCENDHSISIAAIEEALTKKTSAVIAVNLNGRACRLDKIREIAEKNSLIFIEDNAQGLGAKLGGKSAGTFGQASTLSFFPAKILGCYGDGGAVITDNHLIYNKVLELRNHGRNQDGEVVSWGFNSRLDNLQAAILEAKLAYLPESIRIRRKLAGLYLSGLSDVHEIVLPEGPSESSDHFDSFQNFEIEASRRDDLQAHLKKNGIGTLRPWNGKAVHQFDLPGMKVMDMANTERIFKKILLLPMNQYLFTSEVERIINVIRDFYGYKASYPEVAI
jgi:dTDP-4-amino-4,6-dideoxygalactose transaminase